MKVKKIFFLLLTALLTGCLRPQDKILGTWKTVSGGETVYFTFQKNNELNVNNQIYMKYFITKDKKIILGREEPVPFSIKGGTLRIEQENLTLIYTRVK
jgi:hypothetical protein